MMVHVCAPGTSTDRPQLVFLFGDCRQQPEPGTGRGLSLYLEAGWFLILAEAALPKHPNANEVCQNSWCWIQWINGWAWCNHLGNPTKTSNIQPEKSSDSPDAPSLSPWPAAPSGRAWLWPVRSGVLTVNCKILCVYVGYPQMVVTLKWMVYKGKSHWNVWFRGTHIYGNPHVCVCELHWM